jgi:hypothetical protein
MALKEEKPSQKSCLMKHRHDLALPRSHRMTLGAAEIEMEAAQDVAVVLARPRTMCGVKHPWQ